MKKIIMIIAGENSPQDKESFHKEIAREGLPGINPGEITHVMVGASYNALLTTEGFESYAQKHFHYHPADERLMVNGHIPSKKDILAAIKNVFERSKAGEVCLTSADKEVGQTIWNSFKKEVEPVEPLDVLEISYCGKDKLQIKRL